MGDLGNVDDPGRAHVDHGERRRQHAGIGVLGAIMQRQIVLDVAIVVGIDETVGQQAPQQALIGMDVRVDEAGDENPVRAIDNHRAGGRDVRPYVANLAVFDQNVGGCEIADCAVERQHDAAFEQNPARRLHTP